MKENIVFKFSGGPLLPNDLAYIERKTDQHAHVAIERGDFVHIIVSCQMDKTSLLYRS